MKRITCVLLALLCVATTAFADDYKETLQRVQDHLRMGGTAIAKYKGSDIYDLALSKYKSSEAVEEYLCFYDRVWGDLHASVGGVAFSTLTDAQRKLVNFPDVDYNKVYYTPSGKSYHSTDMCYTLLRSKEIRSGTFTDAILGGHGSGCSKCVR